MTAYEGWAIVELMGHRRIAGRVSEADQYGARQLRVDVPAVEGREAFTQFYGGGAVYCVTPTDEETARRVAVGVSSPQPVFLLSAPRETESDACGPQILPLDEDDDEDDIPW